MKIIFLLGTVSEKNAEKLKAHKDSIEIYPYGTVRDMMDNVSQRNATFDRIVVSIASMNNSETMEVLHKFLKKKHPRATVVYLYKKEDGLASAKQFNKVFNSPLYTDVAAEVNSLNFLEEISTGAIDEVRSKYSLVKRSDVKDTIDDSYPDEEVKPSKGRGQGMVNSPMLVLPQSRKQSKATGFFGIKKLTKREEQLNAENMRLAVAYYRYIHSGEDSAPTAKNNTMPNSVRKSTSNRTEVFETIASDTENVAPKNINIAKKSLNLDHDSTFTQVEFGYYGFSKSYKGKPMLFKTGISTSQAYLPSK